LQENLHLKLLKTGLYNNGDGLFIKQNIKTTKEC